MLKKYIYICLLAAVALFNYSCSKKDLGNYEYHDINEVKFPSELNGKIIVQNLTQLTISPKVLYTLDPVADSSRYKYEWQIVNGSLITIGKTKDLDLFVSMPANTYQCYYRITDNVTGIKFTKNFIVEVRNEFNEGWLLMCDVNGKARVDMISKNATNQFLVVKDLLTKTNSGLKLTGKPKLVYGLTVGKLSGYGINSGTYAIYIGTDQYTDRVDQDIFKWDPKFNVTKEIVDPSLTPEDFVVEAIQQFRVTPEAYMITSKGNVYYTCPPTGIKYSLPLNYDNAKYYKVAPFIAASEQTPVNTTSAFFYDVVNRRFLQHGKNLFAPALEVVVDPSNTPSNPLKFSYEHTGKDLVYMAYSAKGNEVYAVFKDLEGSKRYLARFNAQSQVQTDFKEILAENIDKAESFAMSPLFGYIYYNVGGKLYKYDYNVISPTQAWTVVKDYGTSKITALKFQYYQKASKYPFADRLMVCSYDPALPEGENGKIEQFNLLNGGGLGSAEYTYSGCGKVKSLHYRER
ncbi:PKD-like family lipoprotein [Pedobacter nyackensis]|uniref:PKD-like family protein n=1 Tax=Pedobacter nyackensis TaxID=475255 RepID=A0A1W2CQ75_9SPHI|nr:PKD-like family lipoprotein [Pedobacter nyackensis]SMC87369.1 PKD-like family protein [Pedobacter nyackensis]